MDSKIRNVLSNLRRNQPRALERNRPVSADNQASSTARPTNRAADRPARPNRRTDTTLLDIHDRFDLPKPSAPPFGGRTGPVAIPINPNGPGADNFIPPHEYYEQFEEHREQWGPERAGPVAIPRNPNAPGADDFILPHELERIKDRILQPPIGKVPEKAGPTPVNVDDIGIDIFPDDWGQVVWEEPIVTVDPDRVREWAE